MRAARIAKHCAQCNTLFFIPPCRVWREHCCSSACKVAHAAQVLADGIFERVRTCPACNSIFIPRQTQVSAGQGRFCSKVCGISSNQHVMHTPAVKAARADGIRQAISSGRLTYRTGPDNPCWSGGPAASYERAKPKFAAKTRAYRKRNPEKVREWSQKRESRKTGRLPRGTVMRLIKLQKNTCAICRGSLKPGYHVDHILALARGGKHERNNIQLLCPPCNVRKGAKDPIDYMQSKGFLL